MPKQPFTAFCFIMFIYLLKTISVAFPIRVIQITVGAFYSAGTAFLVNLTGSTLGFITAYAIGKMLGEEYVTGLADRYPRFRAIVNCQHNSTVFFSFILRMMSFIPVDVASMYMGATKSNFCKYLVGSIIGTIPEIVIATAMGQHLLDPLSKGFLIPFSLLTMLSVLSFICYLIYIRKYSHTDT